VSSHSQLDRVSIMLEALRSIPGVVVDESAETSVRDELKAFAYVSERHGKQWAVGDFETLRAEKARLQADLDACRARDKATQLAALRYERGQVDWRELMRHITGAA
jgi:hypothetical protein